MPLTRLRKDEFAKYHALGNDYIVLDPDKLSGHLNEARVREICDRNRGIGSDGILALESRRGDGFGLRIFNPDGSEAEKSGNGVRIFARFLFDFGYTTAKKFKIETLGGTVAARLMIRRGNVYSIRLDVGRARFESESIPMRGPKREVIDEPVRIGNTRRRITCVSVGNPHCVLFVPELIAEDLRRLGPQIEKDPLFPERTNVQLACVRSRSKIEALIWERGAGPTLASGTSSCAIVAAAYRQGLVDRKVEVTMPGGMLEVEVDDDFQLRLIGPATPVYRGKLI